MGTANSAISVEEFFNNDNQQFVIPNYQRRYAWKNKQVMDLFYDIHYLNQGQKHLLNMTILIENKKTERPREIFIVDGQQRITTLILLIKVLWEKYDSFGNECEKSHLYDMKKCLRAKTGKNEKIKLRLGKLDSKNFEDIMEGVNRNKIDSPSRLQTAYIDLKEKIENFPIEDVEMYWDKLKNDVVIIDYKVDNSGDAYKLFEITNNRGLELTKTDIIKNFILGHIAIIVENSDGDEKRLKKILEKWQEIIVNLDGIKKDDFFRHFLMGRTCSKIPFSRIITKFKDYYFLNVEDVELLTEFKRYNDIYETPESTHRKRIEKFLDDLINSSKIYRQIVIDGFGNNTLTKELTNLKKIEATPTYSFLLAFITKMDMDKEVELKKVVKVIKVLQTFMIRRHICKERTGELDDIFSNLCDVDCNDTDQLVLNVKQRLQKYYPDDNKFVEEFPNHDYKGKVNRAKYVLEQIEYRIKPPNEKMIVWEEVELEHIIPQKIKPKNSKKFGDWEKYLGEKDTEKHPEYLNKIGNLTLLTKELNLKASNNPFFTKRDEYVGSDIELTKNLCNYRFFKIKNIKERSNWLAQKSLEIWKF